VLLLFIGSFLYASNIAQRDTAVAEQEIYVGMPQNAFEQKYNLYNCTCSGSTRWWSGKYKSKSNPKKILWAHFQRINRQMVLTSFKNVNVDLEQQRQQQQIAHLIDTIDDDIDVLHANYSPSVKPLIKIGLPALEPLLEKMVSAEQDTRLRLGTAIGGIIASDLQRDYKEIKEFWQTVGELDYEASLEERIKVTQNIREWYKKRDEKFTPAKP
jgi:uncharacterized UPF0160 family protein